MQEKKIRPQDRWDLKAGISAKTYKVNTAVADEFKSLCKELHLSQGPELTKLMQQFIEKNK
ncbi:MAG: hypothetical protein ACLVFL_09110 [Eubacterium sp.]|jgi:hypothetical protein